MKKETEFCTAGLAVVLLALVVGSVDAQTTTRRWVAPWSVVDVLLRDAHYTSHLNNQFFDWNKGGDKLKAALKPLGATAVPDYGYKAVTRTNVPDGGNNECVAFSRGCTGAPGSSTWRRGRPVIFDSGVTGGVTQGTLIATFIADSSAPGGFRYSGHTGLFAGYTTDRPGISIWDQNWNLDRTMIWHRFDVTNTGRLSDAKAYFVVETVSK